MIDGGRRAERKCSVVAGVGFGFSFNYYYYYYYRYLIFDLKI